jgi:hypothetical protein
MSQIITLQSEVKALSAAQLRTGSRVHQQEEELEKQQQINEDLKKKYQVQCFCIMYMYITSSFLARLVSLYNTWHP